MSDYFRLLGKKGGIASGQSRRQLRDRVEEGIATEEEEERYRVLCEEMKRRGKSGGKAKKNKARRS